MSARPPRRRRAGRRHHRVERLAERGDPGDAAGRQRRRSPATTSRSPASPSATARTTSRGARPSRSAATAARSRRCAPRSASTRSSASRPPRPAIDMPAGCATSTWCWAIPPGARRRPHGAHLPQPAGDVDLGGRAHHGGRRRALAHRPPPPGRRPGPGPGAPCGRSPQPPVQTSLKRELGTTGSGFGAPLRSQRPRSARSGRRARSPGLVPRLERRRAAPPTAPVQRRLELRSADALDVAPVGRKPIEIDAGRTLGSRSRKA